MPVASIESAQRTLDTSNSQPLSPIPQLTGSNELDWQLVQQLQSLLAQPDASLTPDEQNYLRTRMSDPYTCFRYLLGRGGDLQRAAQSIKQTTRWRLANRVDELTAAALEDKLRDSHMWVSEGTARDGTPLIITKKTDRAETDHERQFQLIVYTLERALRTLALRNSSRPPATPPTPANPDTVPLTLASDARWTWFIDLEAFDSGSSTPLSETRRIVDTLMNQYVERLNVNNYCRSPRKTTRAFTHTLQFTHHVDRLLAFQVAILLNPPRYFLCQSHSRSQLHHSGTPASPPHVRIIADSPVPLVVVVSALHSLQGCGVW